jgi:hypothetical protein
MRFAVLAAVTALSASLCAIAHAYDLDNEFARGCEDTGGYYEPRADYCQCPGGHKIYASGNGKGFGHLFGADCRSIGRYTSACQKIGAELSYERLECVCPSGDVVPLRYNGAARTCGEAASLRNRCIALGGSILDSGDCVCEHSRHWLKPDEMSRGVTCARAEAQERAELEKYKKGCAAAGGEMNFGVCRCAVPGYAIFLAWDKKRSCAEITRERAEAEEKKKREAQEALDKKCAARGARATIGGNCECPSGLLVEEGQTCSQVEAAHEADCKARGAEPLGSGCQCPASGFPAPPGKTCAQIEGDHAAKCEFLGGKPERRSCRCPLGLAISPDKDRKNACAEIEGRAKLQCESSHAVLQPDPVKTDAWLCRCPTGGKTIDAAMGECCLRNGSSCTGTIVEGGHSLDPRDSLFDLIEIGQALKFRLPAQYVVIRDVSKRIASYMLDSPLRIMGKSTDGFYTVKFRFKPVKQFDDLYGECDLDDYPSRREVILRDCKFADKDGAKRTDFGHVAPLSVPYGGLPHPTIPMPVCPTPPTI